MSVGPASKLSGFFPLLVAAAIALVPGRVSAETLEIGIGTQNTTTNTVTGGVVLKELGLFEKHLPKTGKYKDFKYKLSWQNATSGPPITNGMMANNIQIGMMGDYPLMVNGATGQATGNETQLVAIIAYNALGGGNGIVVHKDSPYYELADLKGKNVSVPFGSAAHGMMLTRAGEARTAAGLLEPGVAIARGRQHQPAGKAHRRPWRLRAVRRAAAVPRFRPQDLRRRRDQDADLPRRRRAQGFRREISGDRRRLYRGADGSERLDAQEPEARRREDRGVDQDQQGSRLHLPRPRRRPHARSDHQAGAGSRPSVRTTRSCRS